MRLNPAFDAGGAGMSAVLGVMSDPAVFNQARLAELMSRGFAVYGAGGPDAALPALYASPALAWAAVNPNYKDIMQTAFSPYLYSGGEAYGDDRVFASPAMIRVAETGPERVTVSPLAGAAHYRGGREGPTLNFYGPTLVDNYTAMRLGQELRRAGNE